jgi:hypothetical protein
MATEKEQERPVIVRVDNRFIRGDKTEVCITDSEEVVEVKKFETTPAVVRRGYGLTLNQGNYESARIDVSVEVPCYLADLKRADEFAAKFCEERVRKEVAEARGHKQKKSPI